MNSTSRVLLLFCFLVTIYLFSMQARLGGELADDAAFFLRYAENMLAGRFWVWNIGEPPVWGASAPLYPLVVAIPIALGVSPVAALVGTGLALTAVSFSALVMLLGYRFSFVAGAAFLVFSALDTGAMYFAGAGLETPLTFSLLAVGVWILLGRANLWLVGIIAGLLMVQKLDLVPAGALLLGAYWLKERRFPIQAIAVAATLALSWYGFAWLYFGAPVPNSFLTKSIYQVNHPKSIDWRWFGGFVLLAGIHTWLVFLSVLAVAQQKTKIFPLVAFLGGVLITHLVAYTIKYPFEPYNWYCMPSVFALLVLGSIGVHGVAQLSAYWFQSRATIVPTTISILLVGLVFATTVRDEVRGSNNIKVFASHQEHDRAEAGRWVNANTPKEFSVYTMWGNPAYYSQRRVLDGSFLNRRFEQGDLIKNYRPEILILQNNPGSTPMDPVFAATKGEGYKVVKVFDKTFMAGMDYFFVVLARDDVVGKITDIELPKNLMRFIQNVRLGDKFGLLKPHGRKTLFIHPGLTMPTQFEFDASSYVRAENRTTFTVEAIIAPNVPSDSILRGAANVKLSILNSGKPVSEVVVKVGHPFRTKFTAADKYVLEFIIDNNGDPDTDWLLLSID